MKLEVMRWNENVKPRESALRERLQADAVRKQHEADSMIINFPRRQRA